ncbi:MAG: kinase [Isosphaera sp.]|nr:kinase [Isosphaera sp.]
MARPPPLGSGAGAGSTAGRSSRRWAVNLSRLIDGLSRPTAYPHPADGVEVRQTHISAVFLAGDFVYKVKKPVDLGFVDFRDPARRRHFCDEEVRLNRRLAPDVYLGVVPVTDGADGLRVGGDGEAVEWAVRMARLPDGATLAARVGRGDIPRAAVEALAARVAAFHAAAGAGPEVAAGGRFEVVAANARDNFGQAPAGGPVFDRVRELTEAALAELRPLIEARAARGVPRDTHGDLRLDHVYLFPDRPPPGDVVVIDCVEFADRFRFADPVADASFLVMDLKRAGRRDLAAAFADAYFRAAGDGEGRGLLPFYTAYRAAVRGKVDGLKALEPEVPAADRAEAAARSRAAWRVALGELEPPARRPALVLVGGLPGTGKSTLARGLAGRAGFRVIRSDEVRKELAAGSAGDLYTPEWTERTYRECARRAETVLADGGRVVVDASFREDGWRREFLGLAARLGVPAVFVLCRADPDLVRARLAARTGDASDADWSVYRWAADRWEEPGGRARAAMVEIDTGGEDPAGRVVRHLRREALA